MQSSGAGGTDSKQKAKDNHRANARQSTSSSEQFKMFNNLSEENQKLMSTFLSFMEHQKEKSTEVNLAGKIFCCNASYSTVWILDSGATDHMTCDKTYFANVLPVSQPTSIHLPNGSTSNITHTGDIHLSKTLCL